MEPFRAVTGIAVPLLGDNIDTDQIAPASDRSRRLDPNYAELFFALKRWRADGSEDPAFVLEPAAAVSRRADFSDGCALRLR